MTTDTRPSTREHLLTVAERLFLEEGFDAVSVRSICAAAKANPAAVHYHFGSKDALTITLLQERLGPLWDTALDGADLASGTIDELLETVVAPLVTMAQNPVGHLHLQLLARFARPKAPWTRPWFRLESWSDVLVDMVDGLPDAEARRRWAIAFELILLHFGRDTAPTSAAVDSLTRFVGAGLSAPWPPAAQQPDPAGQQPDPTGQQPEPSAVQPEPETSAETSAPSSPHQPESNQESP